MTTLRDFEKQIDIELLNQISRIGFYNFKKHIYRVEVDENSYGILIIEKSDRRTGDTWYVNPIIGFINKDIAKIYKEVTVSFSDSNTIETTVFRSLGYFTPRNTYITWDFTIGDRPNDMVTSLTKTIEQYVLPKFRELANPNNLLATMVKNEIGLEITNRLNVPLLLYIMGRPIDAISSAENYLSEIRPSPKNIELIEPDIFYNRDAAFSFFRQDKDPLYYKNYKAFFVELKKLCRV